MPTVMGANPSSHAADAANGRIRNRYAENRTATDQGRMEAASERVYDSSRSE